MRQSEGAVAWFFSTQSKGTTSIFASTVHNNTGFYASRTTPSAVIASRERLSWLNAQ